MTNEINYARSSKSMTNVYKSGAEDFIEFIWRQSTFLLPWIG